LLLVLIAPALTTYFWIQYQKSLVKREVKWKMIEGIDKNELVLLKFTDVESKTLLRWKHSKEFEYNLQMYDIVETKVVGDSLYYWCWWDYKETELNKQLAELVKNTLNNSPQKKEKQEHLFSFFKSLFSSNKFNLDKVYPAQKTEQNNIYLTSLFSNKISPPTPPPQLV